MSCFFPCSVLLPVQCITELLVSLFCVITSSVYNYELLVSLFYVITSSVYNYELLLVSLFCVITSSVYNYELLVVSSSRWPMSGGPGLTMTGSTS